MISVAATTSAGSRASYSNFGPRIDLAAPGGSAGNGLRRLVQHRNHVAGRGLGFLSLRHELLGAARERRRVVDAFGGAGTFGRRAARPPEGERQALPGRLVLHGSDVRRRHPRRGQCACGVAQATTGDTVPVTMVEYYHAALDHYFVTWLGDEIVLLDAGLTLKGWRRTGKTFLALRTPAAGTAAVCRIYIPPGKATATSSAATRRMRGNARALPTFISEARRSSICIRRARGLAPRGPCPCTACSPIARTRTIATPRARGARRDGGEGLAGRRRRRRCGRDVRAGLTSPIRGDDGAGSPSRSRARSPCPLKCPCVCRAPAFSPQVCGLPLPWPEVASRRCALRWLGRGRAWRRRLGRVRVRFLHRSLGRAGRDARVGLPDLAARSASASSSVSASTVSRSGTVAFTPPCFTYGP